MDLCGVVLDCDGTVYRGDTVLPGAPAAVARLRAAGVPVVFVTNNPTASPTAYARKLSGLGIPTEPGAVVTAGATTARYLATEHPEAAVYVVGEAGLCDQLARQGVTVTEATGEADVVLVSIDRAFTYDRLAAARAALAGGATFVGTDPDRVIPAGPETVVPGSGAIIGAVAAAAGREPDIILGKPSEPTLAAARELLPGPATDWLVVGDRRDTDVALGARAGATTVLVESGVPDDGGEGIAGPEPDLVASDLREAVDRVTGR